MRAKSPAAWGIAVAVAMAFPCAAPGATLSGDFDGDGFDDLGIGIQNETVNGMTGVGGVQIVYGSRSGLSARDRVITRKTRGIKGTVDGDGFGSALAAGDFDGDGFDDLAVGAPFDDTGETENAGTVQIIYGSRRGLTGKGDQLIARGRGGLGPAPEEFSGFGWTLAAGNLVGDRRDDLAVDTFLGRVGDVANAGYVHVLRGTRDGIATTGARRFSQASKGVIGNPQDYGRFGIALAIGNVGRSGHNDLAIGEPGATIGGGATDAGRVHVLFGSRRGVRSKRSQYLDQFVLYGDGIGVDGTPEIGDFFGSALAIGNLNERRRGDLIIGAPGEDVTDESPAPTADSGLVSVTYGGRRGVNTAPRVVDGFFEPVAAHTWTAGAQFGASLATADVGKSRLEDVIIGSPRSDGTAATAGAVGVVYGGGNGGSDQIQQGIDEIAEVGETGDLFGHAVGAGRFDGRGKADVAIGVPGEGLVPENTQGRTGRRRGSPTPVKAGAVAIVRGRRGGISRANDFLLFQGRNGLAGIPQVGENFGIALSGPDALRTSD